MIMSEGLSLEPSCCLLHKDDKTVKNDGCKGSDSGCGYEGYGLVGSPRTLVHMYMTTQCLVPKDSNLKRQIFICAE
jgi:hypothetical protein